MEVIKIEGEKGVAAAEGLERAVDLQFLKNVRKGDYVVIHAGFAIEKIDKEKAKETLKLYREMNL